MSRPRVTPSGKEAFFGEEQIIVSKTDLRGVMIYTNDVFLHVSGYTEAELIGKPHNMIRHPDMPRCVFKLLWDNLQAEREVFAYVLNMAKNGDHYWVFAHVTPSYDLAGKLVGYHSNRRKPYPDALQKIKPLYKALLDTEKRLTDPRAALEVGTRMLEEYLASSKQSYGEFVFGLSESTSLEAAA
jgi:PAS domain S-box-containing protein